jgi:formylglycine-generating enzyme required for sulfatase activity
MSEVFEEARALRAELRAAYLDEACGEDRELRKEVEKLLAVGTDAIGQTLSAAPSSAEPPEIRSGGRIGDYRLLRVIASGGMGTVWEAEQGTPHRRVALKVMRFGFSGPEDVSRFRYESEILGRLQHPGIAQVFEAGTHVAETEVPYFVMEYIEGAKTILEYSRDLDLSVRKKLELLLLVCDAVQHGHQKGVIHRDLKPSNILVDSRGNPKIIDFGIARVAASDGTERTLRTQAGQILGTLQYMSPEQFGPDPGAVDTRSDVYALGVVLYELLAGRGPYDLSGKSIHEAARIVAEEPASLDRAFAGDLEWIVLKAIDKDRDRRYASASELAADIQRHLADEPVQAGPPSRAYKVRKFVVRHRFGVGASALVVVLLVSGLVTSLYYRARSEAKAVEATEQARIATKTAEDVLSLSAIQDLKDLEDRADALWPADPEMAPKYEAWLADARQLIEGRAADPAKRIKKRPSLLEHEAKLAEIRLRAKPAAAERGSYEFDDADDRWWNAQLSKLVTDLAAFTDERTGGLFSSATSEKHGWGIVKRLEYARTIDERSVAGAEARERWSEAAAAIAASPKYGGLKLEPQRGLLPIGADPESGLWEFADLQTGEPPERGADGGLVRKESMAIVFVLIPGGTFRMGAQKTDPNAPNYDPHALHNESPVHEVTLSPYFVSKYEMTQAQWERFVGRNPSNYGPKTYSKDWNRAGKSWSGLHPVEQVTWEQATEAMTRLGFTLPSEAQWEYAARGGTETPFWTGSDLESLKDAGNLGDAYGKSHGNEALSLYEKDLDDGNSVHAEVGSYRANPFGLHDVIGNLWEWCLDGFDPSYYAKSPKVDPIAPSQGAQFRALRGGGFVNVATFARSSNRDFYAPGYLDNDLGLRPARIVRRSAR